MKNKILEYFDILSKIPHCSQNSDKLLKFLKEFSIKMGYSVEIDDSKNILVKKGQPKLVLQAHYDMVCIGDAPNIKTYIQDGWMYAENSSLGADNGIAIAMMMLLMDMGMEFEFLFTSNEEIGLIGASALSFKLESTNMLNLDFEDEAEVCIGCAGGVDLYISPKVLDESKPLNYNYKVTVTGLAGGHSGVDIDKNIPNAIKVLANYLKDKRVLLSSFEGGERKNSIPVNAVATLSSFELLNSTDMIKVEQITNNLKVYNSRDFINLLVEFQNGVHSFNKDLNIPNTSINLAIVSLKSGNLSIESSARAMSTEELYKISLRKKELFKKYGFNLHKKYKYPSWRPEINDFTQKVYNSMEKVFGKSKYVAIHAGLECGIISEKYPNIKFASIGPTIIYPHSSNEGVKIDSIEKIFEVILKL